MIIISKDAVIAKMADIEDSVKGTNIIINEGVHIDSFVKIKPVGGVGDVHIGKNSYINSCTVIYTGNGVEIGEDVLIGPNCTLAPTNHEYKVKNKTIKMQRFKESKGGIIIEDDVWIGANCVVLDGSIIKKGAVIGANSLVNGEVPEYSICVGSPARKIGERE
ncbi:acyltransferase [Clostridium sp. UBA4548]|uniref:acyltransferase n=1 Tax=Clostridium sp. UBA4548 TaxID=1946361 RepID=UPI0025C5CE09|nr:acyltransferase [Clostridium sp. UBA4548]